MSPMPFVLLASAGQQAAPVIPPDLTYLWKDDFLYNLSAPLASPRNCSPGPGVMTIFDTQNKLSVVGNQLVCTGGTNPLVDFGNPGFALASTGRVTGKALIAYTNFSDTLKTWLIGFHRSSTPGSNFAHSFHWESVAATGLARRIVAPAITSSIITSNIEANINYQTMIILRTSGAFYYIKGGYFSDWTLLYVDFGQTDANVYPVVSDYNAAFSVKNFRGKQLSAPFSDNYGPATQHLTGARSVADAFTHEANGFLDLESITLPSAGSILVSFRKQDSNNYWAVEITSAGNINLNVVVGGASTTLATTSAGVVLTGQRIFVSFDGAVIRGYSNEIFRWANSNRADFYAAASGSIESLGTSGGVTGLVTWPRYPTSTVITELNKENLFTSPSLLYKRLLKRTLWSGTGTTDWLGRPALCNDGTKWIVIYRQGSDHGNDAASKFHIRFSTDEGITWTVEDTFTDGGACVGAPFVCHAGQVSVTDAIIIKAPNGDLLVHVNERVGDGTYQYRSTDGGKNWTDEGEINSDASFIGGQDYVIIGSDIYITEFHDADANGDNTPPYALALYKSSDNGAGAIWTKVGDVESTGGIADELGIAWLGGSNLLIIARDASSATTYKYTSSNLGATWSARESVGAQLSVLQRPRIRNLAGGLMLIGRDQRTTEEQTVVYFSTDNGSTWSKFYPDYYTYSDSAYCDVLQKANGHFYMLSYGGTIGTASVIEYIYGSA